MKENNKSSFQEFEVFNREEEKQFLIWFMIADIFFLAATLILTFVSENIFHMNILGWKQYWILFFANVAFFSYFVLSLKNNFKTWLLKYLLAIYAPWLVGGWIYFSNPAYTKILFGAPMMMLAMIGFVFYSSRLLLMASFVIAVMFGFLFFNFSRIGSPMPPYEICLIYTFLIMSTMLYFALIERTKVFLKELLETRSGLEEAKTTLEIKVKARTEELEELTKSLDQKISERTHELEESKSVLQDRVNELERLHNLTIGRELKMLGLKKEIQKLNDQLSKKG